MKNLCLALALALFAVPASAVAQDAPPAAAAPALPPRPQLSPAQRQAMFKTMSEFRGKEMQLHQQLRSQMLGALSPEHRTAVANIIGQMAISASPDPGGAAKQIDALLTPAEKQSITTAHGQFVDQSRTLMQQMMSQMKSTMPSPPPGAPQHAMMAAQRWQKHNEIVDPGTILLTTLNGGGMRMMMAHGFGAPGGPPPPPQP
jgi:hypothetical protein